MTMISEPKFEMATSKVLVFATEEHTKQIRRIRKAEADISTLLCFLEMPYPKGTDEQILNERKAKFDKSMAEYAALVSDEREVWQAIEQRYIDHFNGNANGLLDDCKETIDSIKLEEFIEYAETRRNRLEEIASSLQEKRQTEKIKDSLANIADIIATRFSENYSSLTGYIMIALSVQFRALEQWQLKESPVEDEVLELIHRKVSQYYTEELAELSRAGEFLNVPSGTAIDLIINTIVYGDDISSIPSVKGKVNRKQKHEYIIEDEKQRKLILTSKDCDITLTINNIEDIVKGNKSALKLFVRTLTKISGQAVHKGELVRDVISFPLQELVDDNNYASERSARAGFIRGIKTLETLSVEGIIHTRGKKASQEKSRTLFIGHDVDDNQCVIYINSHFEWELLLQYYTKIPPYIFSLGSRAFTLAYYIFKQARINRKQIAEKGYFNISFRAIQAELNLPNESQTKSPQRDIKDEIEKAVEQIEQAHSEMYGNTDFQLLPVYNENARIKKYLDNGYLKVTMLGEFAEPFISLNKKAIKIREKNEQQKERVKEKALVIIEAEKIKKEQ